MCTKSGLTVSIHAPTWGATLHITLSLCLQWFQSTHPHGVRLGRGRDRLRILCVSIHAPTWGATTISPSIPNNPSVSIHAPTWGATIVKGHADSYTLVSIHAPTWGAT